MEYIPYILVVDDEQDLREILEYNLSSEGFNIDTASSAEEALKLPLEKYDLILLDVMMGGMSGYKLADILRKKRKIDTPIVFLTAKSDENDLITGFNVGGDDYIMKPFSINVLVVRIKAVLKRGKQEKSKPSVIKYKKLVLDQNRKSVYIDKEEIELTRKEYAILFMLMKNSGKFISRDEILNEVWSNDVIVTDRNVDVTITRIRKKIGKYSNRVVSKTGHGYCFETN